MSDRNSMTTGVTDKLERQRRENFLRFHFKEMKDTFKQLFTLISAVFAFSAAVRAKPPVDTSIGWRLYHFSPFLVLFLSFSCCAISNYILGVAGDKATNLNAWGFLVPSWNKKSHTDCMLWASHFFDAAGVLFLVGLLVLAVVAIF